MNGLFPFRIAAVLAFTMIAASTAAQSLNVATTRGSGACSGVISGGLVGAPWAASSSPAPTSPGYLGSTGGQRQRAERMFSIPGCIFHARAYGHMIYRHSGTHVDVFLHNASAVGITCNDPASTYSATASSVPFHTELDFTIDGVPAGTPVTVYYTIKLRAGVFPEPEAVHDDFANLFDITIDLGPIRAVPLPGRPLRYLGLPISAVRESIFNGQITWTAGTPLTLKISSGTDAGINPPPIGGGGMGDVIEDWASSWVLGTLSFWVGSPPPVPEVFEPQVDFSVDLNSPNALTGFVGGIDVFDPGDAYLWRQPAMGIPTNGILNDLWCTDPAVGGGMQFDPWPDPALLPPGVPPLGSGQPLAQVLTQYFDLDGHDSLDLDLSMLIPPAQPLTAPMFLTASCVHPVEYVLVSFDDNGPNNYLINTPMPDHPFTRPSTLLRTTFGQASRQDELIGILFAPDPLALPALVSPTLQFAITDEQGLHGDLMPNPLSSMTGQTDDDDVDSLDVQYDAGRPCGFWYYSVDHEATGQMSLPPAGLPGPLDPGTIYLARPNARSLPVVVASIHLGLQPGVDLDAFEFVRFDMPPYNGQFGLIFSVDTDDPGTVADESGGLDPTVIYGSLLNGLSFPVTASLGEDIDALAVSRELIYPLSNPGPCPLDLNADAQTDLLDLMLLVGRLGSTGTSFSQGGFDTDGDIDAADLATLLTTMPCP